jgi:transcriptional regulator GlxA family with amidase domain
MTIQILIVKDERIVVQHISQLSYFCRFFHQEIGCSPYQYIIQERVTRAKTLLMKRDILINDISIQ